MLVVDCLNIYVCHVCWNALNLLYEASNDQDTKYEYLILEFKEVRYVHSLILVVLLLCIL